MEKNFGFQIQEVILNDSHSLFTNASITSLEQSNSAEVPFAMIKRKKNEGEIMLYYNIIEPIAKRHKLEQETPNPELKKKMQGAVRSKRYRERLKLKKESLEVDPLLLNDYTHNDVQVIPMEVHNPELQEKIQNTNKDDSQSDIPMEELNPVLKKRKQAAIRAKRYRERLKLKKESLEVDPLLINKDDSQSDVQGDISMEALNPVLKKKMQAAIRSKRYRDRLKLRKKSLEVNKNDSQSDVPENTTMKLLSKELKKKMQSAIRSKRYRDRLKLAKECVNVEFLSIKHDSESDDVSGDSHKDGNCLFYPLIKKLQHQMLTSELPEQLLQSAKVHSCIGTNNTMRILCGELDSKALDCVTLFSKLLVMNKGVWPVKYS